ncbi:MAG: FAD binding domain-containing protein [Chloroflexi bacterium]|nr:FAD binding domain-containing protein [Chloroflexota bacterium]
MKAFELYDAKSVQDAVALLNKFGPTAKIVAGGSDLVAGVMKDWVYGKGMPYPEKLIDVTTIADMVGIKVANNTATIGAATTLTSIEESPDLKKGWPVFTDSALSVASPLIRNFGTLGGNLNQRPRCWFFRGENFACYKKGGDFCFAVTGDNRYHAIVGGELCYIVHPSDTATSLLALNAAATVAGPSGQRTVQFDDYFKGPRDDVLRENVLKNDELMVNVTIPALAANTKTAWIKLKDRQVYDFALMSVAVVVTQEGGTWKDGRIVLGGVAPVPYRAKVIEDALKGKDIKATLKSAIQQFRTVTRPMSLNAYKVDIAMSLIERAITAAI